MEIIRKTILLEPMKSRFNGKLPISYNYIFDYLYDGDESYDASTDTYTITSANLDKGTYLSKNCVLFTIGLQSVQTYKILDKGTICLWKDHNKYYEVTEDVSGLFGTKYTSFIYDDDFINWGKIVNDIIITEKEKKSIVGKGTSNFYNVLCLHKYDDNKYILRYKNMISAYADTKKFISETFYYQVCKKHSSYNFVEQSVDDLKWETLKNTFKIYITKNPSILLFNSYNLTNSEIESVGGLGKYYLVNEDSDYIDTYGSDLTCIFNYIDLCEKYLFEESVESINNNTIIPHNDLNLNISCDIKDIGVLTPAVEEWIEGKNYYLGDFVKYNDKVYKLIKGESIEELELTGNFRKGIISPSDSIIKKQILKEGMTYSIFRNNYTLLKRMVNGYGLKLSDVTDVYSLYEIEDDTLCPDEYSTTLDSENLVTLSQYTFMEKGSVYPDSVYSLFDDSGNTKLKTIAYENDDNGLTHYYMVTPFYNGDFNSETLTFNFDGDGTHWLLIKDVGDTEKNEITYIGETSLGSLLRYDIASDDFGNCLPFGISRDETNSGYPELFYTFGLNISNTEITIDDAQYINYMVSVEFISSDSTKPTLKYEYDIIFTDEEIKLLKDYEYIKFTYVINALYQKTNNIVLGNKNITTDSGTIYTQIYDGSTYVEIHKFTIDEYLCHYQGSNKIKCTYFEELPSFATSINDSTEENLLIEGIEYDNSNGVYDGKIGKYVKTKNGGYLVLSSLFNYINIDFDNSYKEEDSELVLIEVENDDIDRTISYAIITYTDLVYLKNENEALKVPLFKKEEYLNIQDTKNVFEGNIERYGYASFEKHNILTEINSIDDMENYRNNYFETEISEF